jgi:pyruvate dehydrogenase E2 component (dihydrolipoamide acetyltransferase)
VAFEFKLPDLGEGIREAQVLTWRVAAGQEVAAFQPLCEVESAKAAVELTSPVAGRVVQTRFAEGDVAHLGDVLVVIDTEAPETSGAEWFGIVGSPPGKPAAAQPLGAAEPPRSAPPPPRRVLAAPLVRKLARDRGIRLEDVHGSGPQGRVRLADLDAHSPRAEAVRAPAQQSASGATIIPLKGLRKSIADHMVQAWRTAPQVTSMDLLDVTELVRARDLLRASAAAQAGAARLTYLPFFVKAAIEALKAVPEANAVVDEQQAAIVLKPDFHIGIATAIADGLVVPVLRHADQRSLLDIAAELERLVTAARERRATPADLSGSTFTITSFGGLPGSPLFATPIVNYPEVAILGLGRIDLQPKVVDGQVLPRQCIGVSFTFDHRVLDGEGAGRFMATLKRYVEQPLELLLRLR